MAAETFLSSVIGTVSSEAATFARGEFKLLWGAMDELERLRNSLSLIQAFLDDAERKGNSMNSVKIWLHNLKYVAYDAQDVIDEAATEALRRRVEPRQVTSCFLHVVFYCKIAHKIKVIREKLDQILREGSALGLQPSLVRESQVLDNVVARPPRETHSTLTDAQIVGRSQEIESLVEKLLSPDTISMSRSDLGRTSFSVIAVVGMGGVGKTTLAQLVYNDKRVKRHFDAKIWLCVSPIFDLIRLIHEMIESVSQKRSDLTSLDTLQTCLGRELSEKRFLLVLDDLWNEDQKLWQDLCVPLRHGKAGSKVLITTRNQSVADKAAPRTYSTLSGLTDDECWSILQSTVFADRSACDFPRLEILGKNIACKAKGVPLAAKVLGGILKSIGMDENRWIDILEADISRLPEEAGIMPVLRLSYQHLPPHLKQCFAYCAVFPKHHSINRERLIGMWMALGFISQEKGRIEDLGSDYFDALLGRSFFQYSAQRYSMHDLMQDLAQTVSGDECFIVQDGDLKKVPKNVRHLTFQMIELELLGNLHRFQKLRSLLFFCKYKHGLTPVLNKLFKKLKMLRVLDLDCYDLKYCVCCCSCCPVFRGKADEAEEMPSSIGFLKHLRYLHLYFSDINELPESLGTLYNLQTLMVDNYDESLYRLPKGMSNLVNLRQLKANVDLVSSLPRIGKLTSLQELKKFSVGTEDGHHITELRNLNQIRGSLSLSKLENVISGKESEEAKLENKRYIDTLELEWSKNREASSVNSEHDERVLACLNPHDNLKVLVIRNFRGVRFTGRMQNRLPTFLEDVRLFDCSKLEKLPAFGQLKFLKCLMIRGTEGMERLVDLEGFPSLKMVEFSDMCRWEEWSGVEKGPCFPCLDILKITNCPKLRALPPLPPSLTKLELGSVGLFGLPDIWGCPLKNKVSSKSSLSSSGATAAAEAPTFSSLSRLVISECPYLRSLREGLLRQDLRMLNILRISNCEELVELPEYGLPLAIQNLSVEQCPLLKKRLLVDGGLDWPKIAHIPYIQMDGVLVQGTVDSSSK